MPKAGVGGNAKIPRANDRSWFTTTRPLRDFLDCKNGRSWDEMLPWGLKRELKEEEIRNMLAWLYMDGWAAYSRVTQRWSKKDYVHRARQRTVVSEQEAQVDEES